MTKPSDPNHDLDRALRDLSASTHPRKEFTARLRADLQAAPAPRPRRLNFWAALRPWMAQAALVALLVGLVLVAGRLTGHLLPGRPAAIANATLLPAQTAAAVGPSTPAPGQPAVAPSPGLQDLPTGALARLGMGMILSLDSAPDGRLAVATTAGLCLYETGGFTPAWCRWTSAVQVAHFDPTGAYLAVRYSNLPLVEIWDASTGQAITSRVFQPAGETYRRPGMPTIGTSGGSLLAWEPLISPSATSRLVVASADNALTLWDWQNDTTGWQTRARGDLTALDWARGPGGESILAMGDSQGVVLFNGSTGVEKMIINIDPSLSSLPVRPALALSPAGDLLAYSEGREVVVSRLDGWTAPQNSPDAVQRLDAGMETLHLAFAPDGSKLAAAASGLISVFSLPGGQVRPIGAAHLLGPIAWLPDGRLVYAAADGSLAYYQDGSETIVPSGHVTPSAFLAWKDDAALISGGAGYLRAWDTRAALQSRWSMANAGGLVGLSADGARAGYLDQESNSISLWDTAENRSIPGIGADQRMLAAALHPDGRRMAVVTADGLIMQVNMVENAVSQRDTSTGAPISQVDALVFQPTGDLIAISYRTGDGPLLEVWNTADGQKAFSVPIQESITDLAWSADGARLAVVFAYRVEIWDAAAGQLVQTLNPDPREMLRSDIQPQPFTAAAFSPDGRWLAASGAGVTLYDLTGGQEPRTFHGHGYGVTALAFAPNSRALASASLDGTILVWDLAADTLTPDPTLTVPTSKPTATPLPVSTPAALDLSGYDLSSSRAVSPSGAWIVDTLRGEWTERAPREEDFNRITARRVDGSLAWEYEYTSPHGLGEGWPGGFTFTPAEDFVYFYDTYIGDGCGLPSQGYLRRMDLNTGVVEPVDPFGLVASGETSSPWQGQLSLSPDASLAASFDSLPYNASGTALGQPRLIVTDLLTKEQRDYPFDAPNWENWGVLNAFWSRDSSRILFTLQSPFPPCGERDAQAVYWLVDLTTGARQVSMPDAHTTVAGWAEDGVSLLLADKDGSLWASNPDTGARTQIPRPEPDPIARAKDALQIFLYFLHNPNKQDIGPYKSAAEMYAGDFDAQFPGADPRDPGQLLANACAQRVDACPPAGSITYQGSPQEGQVAFLVEFLDPRTGRALEVQGETRFLFTVIAGPDGAYRVLGLPPLLRTD